MALTLRLRSGDLDPDPELHFDAPRVVVGRAAGSELQLPDPSVSSRHASLRQRGSDYVIVDEGSENGTYVGASRLSRHAPHTLRDGELLRFGRVWVEVQLQPARAASEASASRELARRLVEQALSEDASPHGMTVVAEGTEASLRLEKPRHPYLIGSAKKSDLCLAQSALPARCLELRRHSDQLWVTLQKGVSAALDARPLLEGERTLWPKKAVLTLGEARLTVTDATLQTLERVERGPTERLAEDEVIDPPRGAEPAAQDAGDEAVEDDEAGDGAEEGEDDGADVDDLDAVASETREARARAPAPGLAGRWTLADAVVMLLAVSVLGLSLWAIRWLAQFGSA